MNPIEQAAPVIHPLNLAGEAFDELVSTVAQLGEVFAQAGYELALVGGCVRDCLLGRHSDDLDLTTNAMPEVVEGLLNGWADAVWDVGIRFGTVGAMKNGVRVEITTYRAESYDADSRKPEVSYGESLADDLQRRDFTINAMAVTLPDRQFVDLYGGINDLAQGTIRTPGPAERSFSDDPLRMLRAARFASTLSFVVDDDTLAAMVELSDRLAIVSAERIRDELSKLLLSADPRRGLTMMVQTGIDQYVVPELAQLQLEIDEHHRHKDVYEHSLTVLERAIALEQSHEPTTDPDLVLRLAALLHDIGKPKTRRFEPRGGVSFHHHEVVGAKMTRKRLQQLRYPKEVIEQVTKLVFLHLRFHGYADGSWTDAAVRRYVRDAGDQLTRLHKLTRADCTTRNRRKAAALQANYDSLEQRIAELAQQEQLDAVRPDLDGNEIMQILNIGPGKQVGQAYNHLLELRLDNGPMQHEDAVAALKQWWANQNENE